MSDIPDFAGKYLWLVIANAPDSVVMQNAKFAMQAGRWFIAGEVCGQKFFGGPQDGAPVYVAWDSVESYYSFSHLDELATAIRTSKPKT